MVSVAQSVEPRIVIPVVVGSSPIVHPIFRAAAPGDGNRGQNPFAASGAPGAGWFT